MKFSMLAGIAILAVASAQRVGTWKSLGCYVDASEASNGDDIKEFHSTEAFNSIGQCTDRCSKIGVYKYAAARGSDCYCGRKLDNEKAKDEKECDTPCPGYALDSCGGNQRLNVYIDESFKESTATTDLKDDPPATTTTTITSAGSQGITTSTGSQGTAVPASTTSTSTSTTSLPTGGAGKLGGYGALGVVAGLLVL